MDKRKKAQDTYKKLEDQVVDLYGKAEGRIVDSYKNLEESAMDGLNRLEADTDKRAAAAEDFWVEMLFLEPGETVEQAKQRLADRRAQAKARAEEGLQELGEELADACQAIGDGIYTAYKTLETGALNAADAVMDFCEETLWGPAEDDKPHKGKK